MLCCLQNNVIQRSLDPTIKPVTDSPYNIQLEAVDQSYDCYTATVSNGTYTVELEGMFTLGIVHDLN